MNKEITSGRLTEVIKVDTTSSSRADFLATHVPFRHIKLKHGGGLSQDFETISEDEIWQQYVREPGERHQFIVVQGANGAGKSHLIRWLYTKFQAQPQENEAVIFIRRSDNSLKGAIRQLLDRHETRDLPHRDAYERLAAAGTDINPQELKHRLYHALLAKVQTDIVSGLTDKLKRIQKKHLLSLLSDQVFFEQYLLQPMDVNTPIERIYRRVATDGNLKGFNEEPARFKAGDFQITDEFLERLESAGSDQKAIDYAYDLHDEQDLTVKTADYLNQFIESVIQEAAGVHPGDFESIFAEIRHELFRHGKNLTLLIEDITAFTGVNESLLNVLINEHTGTADLSGQELCRLSSLVGTTTEFYGEFRDNFRNRVTEEIYIEDTALTVGQDNTLVELAARYLNAMSLPANVLDAWAESGAEDGQLPLHKRTEMNCWPTYTLPNGGALSLYPFTVQALKHLVAGMPEGQRTPRYFLTDILRTTVQCILKGESKAFPPVYTGTAPNLQWRSAKERIHIIQQCEEGEQDRLNRFICIWGDGTASQTESQGVAILAGIPMPIYQELGFPVLRGLEDVTTINAAIDTDPPETLPELQQEVDKKTLLANTKTPDEIANENYEKQRLNLEQWLSGGQLNDDRNLIRNDLSDFLCSTINWQEEGVSFDNLNKIIGEKSGAQNQLLSIERCSRGKGFYELPAKLPTYQIINCLLQWRYLGRRSWLFEGAEESFYAASMWLYNVKDGVVQAVKNSSPQIGGVNAYAACAISVAVCCRMLAGGDANPETLAEHLWADNMVLPQSGSGHCRAWQGLLSYLKRPETEDALKIAHDYFNIVQSRKPSTKTFLNLDALQKCLDYLAPHGYLLEEAGQLAKEEVIGARRKPMVPAAHLAETLPKVIKEEQNFLREKLSPIFEAFDLNEADLGHFEAGALEDFSIRLDECNQALVQANKQNCFSKITKEKRKKVKENAEGITSDLRQLAKAITEAPMHESLPQLARAPLADVQPLIELIELVKDGLKRASAAMPSEPPAPVGYVSPLLKDKEKVLQEVEVALTDIDALEEALTL